MIKTVLEPTHSRFGFELSEDTSSLDSAQNFVSGPSKEELWTTESFTKRTRKVLERLLVFFHGEIDRHPEKSQTVFTKKEVLVLRQTVRLAAIGVTYLSTEEPDAQKTLVQLLERLLLQVVEMRVEKEANIPAN